MKIEESIEKLKNCNCFKNRGEENISQEFRLKNIDKTRKYLIEGINQSKLIRKKHKKVCTTLN